MAAGIVRVRAQWKSESLGIVFSSTFAEPKVDNLVACLMFAILDRYMSLFTGNFNNAKRIQLRTKEMQSVASYQEVFNCEIGSGAKENNFVIDRKLLDLTSPLADILTFSSEENRCSTLAKTYDNRGNLIEAVQELLLLSISDTPGIESVADSLNLSVRQLRYLLAKRNTSFQQQVKHCKLKVARKLLQNDTLQLSEVGYQIGFNEVSNFSAAFKKWTGVSPSQYRQRLYSDDY